MTQSRSHLTARLGSLSMIACLVATQAGAQAGGNGLPDAEDIWRHLPGRTSEPVAPSAPAPAPQPTPAVSAAPRSGAPAAAPRRSVPETSAAVPTRTLAQARVVIHYPERGGRARSEALVRLLRALDTGEVETRPVRHAVERQSIRYFHAADREMAGIVGEAVGGGRATVSDFTFYRPLPRKGTIEVWLP
ncbi:hypothetical protein EYE42_05000 [Paracoccus subflavus]|uniref:Uncharacterized protein n=1 Tax=Paracoccus subflavus TaxID=2528244 RepID=A0A4V2JCN7_9RHOB|nr:hypothetical protein EYE42_05000 [Paracoccus subflavus]